MDGRLLGSGGWLPTNHRETACVYLRKGADVLILDAGTGLRRLVTEPELLAGVERLYVALTHFHLDHSVGLITLPGLAGRVAREVWAPGEALYGATTESFVRTLVGPPFLFVTAEELEPHIGAVHELAGEAEIGPFRVETRVQPLHTGPTLALKVDGWLAYCTDTAYDEENVSFVQGARVLLHEAMHASDRTEDAIHSAAGEAARVAAAASVDRLVMVHVNPTPGAEEGLLEHALARFPQAVVGRDGVTFR